VSKLNLIFQILLVVACLTACQAPSAYDSSKSALLTEEKRRELDVLLANELDTWNMNSVRCEGGDPNHPWLAYECRETFFRDLAAQGYEMADIVSKLFKLKPEQVQTVNDTEAFERLRQLADKGDKSALCFVQAILHYHRDNNRPFSDVTVSKYTKQGKELGLPLCAQNEFYLYLNGDVGYGYSKDPALAHQRLVEAASAGLYFSQRTLLTSYRLEGFNNPHTIRKALCWGRLAEHHSSWADFQGYIRDLIAAARDKDDQSKIIHPELEQLANDWSLRATPYDNKPTTPNECMQIEEEN
jgi:hypothetical protein